METTKDIGFGLKLRIVDTDYALSHELINNEARMDTELGMRLK